MAPLDIDGLCDGAIASNHRRNRLVNICQILEIQLVLPLWHKDPAEIITNMIEVGYVIMIMSLGSRAEILEKSWLGRVLDRDNLDDFLKACWENGVSPLGEYGEFETIVLAGPDMGDHMDLYFKKAQSGKLL